MLDCTRNEAIFGKAIALPATRLRRAAFFVVVVATTAFAGDMMWEVLRANGLSLLEAATLVLFVITFGWIAVAFWTAVAGFLIQLSGLDPLSWRRRFDRGAPDAPLAARTAIVMPVYNEDVARVIAGLEATIHDLARTGEGAAFDFFLLSDSTDPEIAATEEREVAALGTRLRARLGDGARLHYRRRADNEGRKAGNIAEFCRSWGASYDYMVILDADSLMTGEALTRLVRAMQANPGAGLIQTVPIPTRQETVFGRLLQFASTLYSPMLATGLAFWQTDTANYWGHNAILRTRAFMDHCGLPTLPGTPPLGGEILSHDFVEAALMRRGGWQVFLFPEIGGSYEEMPGNILDFAKRDQRWAEGNLQHLRLLLARGLHPISRIHFLLGALAYGCSLFWLLMLGVGSIDAVAQAVTEQQYFHGTPQLYPDWPVARIDQMMQLVGIVAALLIGPKVMGLALCLLHRERRRAFGGGLRVTASAIGELVFSILIAPVMMTFHAGFVAGTLCGHRVKWAPQQRDGRHVAWRQALRSTAVAGLVGLVWGTVIWVTTPIFFWAMTPVLAGLVLAAPLIALSSRADIGGVLRRLGLFLTPAETTPDAVLNLKPRAPARSEAPASPSSPLPPKCPRPMPAQRLDTGLRPLTPDTRYSGHAAADRRP